MDFPFIFLICKLKEPIYPESLDEFNKLIIKSKYKYIIFLFKT